MKKIIYILSAMLLFAGSCKKNNGNNNPADNTALLPAATGWVKAGTIPWSNTHLGFEGAHAMTPYDLAVVDNQLALLYSEDDKMSGTQHNWMYKTKFNPGTAIPESTPLKRGGYAQWYSSRFVPGTFTPVYMKLAYSSVYFCTISNEDGDIAGNNLGYNAPDIWPINWYPDGGLTMSVKYAGTANGNISDVLSYTFPNTGNFEVSENQWSLDSTSWITCDALRLTGGAINELIVSRQGAKVYFSILKNDPDHTGVQHNFFIQVRQEMPELNGVNLGGNSIIASDVVDDTYTVLVGEINGTIITKVHCYQWKKGDTQFSRLYGDIAVPEDLGRNLMARSPIGCQPKTSFPPVKFTPDHTAYMLFNGNDYTALATINASGTKIAGKFSGTSSSDNMLYQQLGLSTCQYYNGAYYAVVYPKREELYDIKDPRFRMEIVKLTP